jgi:hypothetical protein
MQLRSVGLVQRELHHRHHHHLIEMKLVFVMKNWPFGGNNLSL